MVLLVDLIKINIIKEIKKDESLIILTFMYLYAWHLTSKIE